MVSKIKSKKIDYNIEYAHIYADKDLGKEQKQSIKELHRAIKRLKRLKKSYVLSVLIDEYNPIENTLDIKKFLAELKELDARPNFLMLESRLVRYKNSLLKKMTGKIKREYEKYIKEHSKVPCSFLIAVWHLKRLGLLKDRDGEIHRLSRAKQFSANKIITILPKKYQAVECKALDIIEATDFKNQVTNISHIFF